MQPAWRLGLLGLLLAALAATAHAWPAPLQAAPSGATSAASNGVSLLRVDRRLALRRAEVGQLQRAIARQQAHSQQASQRLREQDRQIAELQRQLQVLHGGAPTRRGAKAQQQ